jgi:signal transduction histidine kinase
MGLVRDILAGFADSAQLRGVELSLHGPDRLELPLSEATLRAMLENLVDNALRYASASAGAAIEVTLLHDGRSTSLVVADNGPGLPMQQHEQAFERFWRGPGPAAPGAGLGLAIVRQCARGLGGDAVIEPAERGLRVRVHWPAGLQAQAPL